MYLQRISYYGCLYRSTSDLTRLANRECMYKFPQDWLKDQQEISEEWPTKESFKRREILKWRNISDDVYKIKKVSHRESKYGISAILTLKTKCGDELLVWAPKRLAEDLEDESYQFVYKIGLKTSADGNEYFDYELM